MTKIWWLHSLWALAFGVGVMVFAKQGLRYADKLLLLLGISWFLVFIALRFIVGHQNTSEDEKIAKKGLRLLTNYVIKNLYQQMLFFLVPLYAYSATWTLGSFNWLVPLVILGFAVLSTMDLVFDNFVMRHRIIASFMYGVCMFGVLNVILPMVFHWGHFQSLLVAAAATAPAVALLSFRVKAVLRPVGVLITLGAAGGMVAFAWYGRRVVPPAPMSMGFAAVGHGAPGQYECLPGRKRSLPADQLAGLRCVADVVSPAGLHEPIVHLWFRDGAMLARIPAFRMRECEGDVYRSYLVDVPADPTGAWRCTIETEDGQLLGDVPFAVGKAAVGQPAPSRDAGPTVDAAVSKRAAASPGAAPLATDAAPADLKPLNDAGIGIGDAQR